MTRRTAPNKAISRGKSSAGRPDSATPRTDLLAGAMIPWILAAAGGASFLGAWRLCCVPTEPLVPGYPNLWGVGAFLIIGAVASLALAGLWHWLAASLPSSARNIAVSRAALPLLLSWLPLAGGAEGSIWTVFWLIILAGLSGALGAQSLRNNDLPDISPRAGCAIMATLVTLFIVSYSATTILGLQAFYNGSYTDFGGFVNAAWNTFHGHLMWSDHWNGSIWGEHLTVYDLLPALTLQIWPRAEGFLIWQAAGMALAALPIYLMGKRDTGSRAFAVALAFAWIFSPFTGRNVMFEYHSLFFAALTVAWLLWACHPRVPTWLFLTLGIAALITREDMPLPILAIALWETAVGRRYKRGLILMALSIIWGVLSINLLMPSALAGHLHWSSGGSGHIDRYAHLGKSYGEIVSTLAIHPIKTLALLFEPAKLANDLLLLLSLGLLPLFGWKRFWMVLPVFFLHALSNWHFQNELDVHYTSPLLPILFFASIEGAQRLVAWLDSEAHPGRAWRTASALLVGAALASQLFGARWCPGIPPPLYPYDGRQHMTLLAFPWRPQTLNRPEFIKVFQEIRAALPPKAGVAVPDTAVPMVAARHIARSFRSIPGKPMEQLQYVLFHPNVRTYASGKNAQQILSNLLSDPAWHIIFVRQDWIVFGRNEAGKDPISPKLAEIEKRHADTPLGHMIIAQIASETNNQALARREAEKVLAIDPANEYAKQFLSR